MRYIPLLLVLLPLYTKAECIPVATVFDTTICESDIFLPSAKRVKSPTETDRHKQYLALLQRKIFDISYRHLLHETDYTPTEREIDAFLTFQNNYKNAQQQRSQALINTIQTLLTNNIYSDRNEQRLKSPLEAFQKRLAMEIEQVQLEENLRVELGDAAHQELDNRLRAGQIKMATMVVSG